MPALSMAPWPSSFGIPIPFFKQRRRESRQKPIFGHAAQTGRQSTPKNRGAPLPATWTMMLTSNHLARKDGRGATSIRPSCFGLKDLIRKL